MGARRVVGGFVALGLGTLVNQVLGFATLALVARRLGPENVGAVTFALTLASYFAIPANFGVTGLAIRDVAQAPHRARELAGEVLVLQAVLVAIPYAAIASLAPVLAADELTRILIPIAGLTFVVDAFALHWVLYGRERFMPIALSRVIGAVLTLVLVVLLVDGGRDGTLAFAWITLGAVVCTSLITLTAALRVSGRPVLRTNARALMRRFRASVPFGIASVAITVYYSVDAILLGYLAGTDLVGQYAVAYKLPFAFIAIAGLWASAFYPHASALALSDRRELGRQLGQITGVALLVSVPAAAGAALVADGLMVTLFGAEYRPAGAPFAVLMCAAALAAVSISYGIVVTAIGQERRYAVIVACGAVLNLVANLIVIPPFGMLGAAAATVGAEVVVLILLARQVAADLGSVRPDLRRLTRVLAATAVMLIAMTAASGRVPTLGQAAVGAVVFAVAAVPLGAVHTAEVRATWRAGIGAIRARRA